MPEVGTTPEVTHRGSCRPGRLGAGIAAALGAGFLATACAVLVERLRVQLDTFDLRVDRGHLPAEGVTILHLSDLHFGRGGFVQRFKIARLLRQLSGRHYDVVALTGDLIHDMSGLDEVLRLVDVLRPRWGAFFCPGNHDYCEYSVWGVFGHTWTAGGGMAPSLRAIASVPSALWSFLGKVVRNELVRLPVRLYDLEDITRPLADRGYRSLINESGAMIVGNGRLWVAGVDDPIEGRPDLESALAAVPDGELLVLLAHNPDSWLDRLSDRASLILSGHTHGGQIKLPFLGSIHTQGTHLTRRRPAGWFRRGATHMFVSRGLGESIPIRFGVRPQAALIRLLPPG